MYPSYGGGMNPYPYHPTWDFTPPQLKEDTTTASGPSFMYESWPQNCGYQVPMQCLNCGNHAQYPPPYYNFRPPFPPHFPSPQPAYGHFCGGYPISYVTPPHYEYDKKAQGGFHCCGCPNHQCHLKIEEHEPEVETRKSESLVPARVNDVTRPTFWIPPGYVINKEQARQPRRVVENEADKQHVSPYYYIKKPQLQIRPPPTETEAEEQHESPRLKKLQWHPKPIESEVGEHVETPKNPQTVGYEHGLFPLDMSNIKELLEGGQGSKAYDRVNKGVDGKNVDSVENKEQNKQFPLPVFWMPYGGHAKGEELKDASVIPMKVEHPDIESERMKNTVGDDGSGAGKQSSRKTSSVRTIPVKQLEEHVTKPMQKDEERKEEGVVVKTVVKNGNGQSSTLTKKSKLPPICLRVDPPKKKKSNGSSRTPNPPVDKKQHEPEVSKTTGSKKEIQVSETEVEPPSQNKIEVFHKVAEDEIREKNEGDNEEKGAEGHESQGARESRPCAMKILSEQEAASVIQSVYRGYDVRKWEPLKKLKQIAKVREEAGEMKKRIDDLESCSGSCINDRENTIVSENIMNLLLKLDSIQGLHPSFRDMRRSVAKELTNLEEKLDSITNKRSALLAQETPWVENPPKVSSQDWGSDSKSVIEAVEEPSKVSTQLEGSNTVKTVEEPSRIICEIAKESSKVSNQVEGSENEQIFETLEIEVESQSNPQDVSVESTVELVDMPSGQNDEHLNMLAEGPLEIAEDDKNEISQVEINPVREKFIEKAPRSPLEIDSEKEQRHEEVNRQVEIELSQEVIEECAKEQISEFPGSETLNTVQQEDQSAGDVNDEAAQSIEPETCKHEPSEMLSTSEAQPVSESEKLEINMEQNVDVPDESGPEAGEVQIDSEKEQRDEELNRQVEIELSQEVTQECANDQISEFPGSETLNTVQQEEQSAVDVNDEAAQSIEPETCKHEPSEMLSINEAQPVSESEKSEINTEQNVHVPDESGPEASEVHGVPSKSEDNSLMTSNEDQERTSVEGDYVIHDNLRRQSVGSETEALPIEMQQPKPEEVTSREQVIEKRVIEENEKLREMVERLIVSGKEQQDVISSLSGKLKDLEKKLVRNKSRTKPTRRCRVLVSRPRPCVKGSLSDELAL